MAVAGLFIHGLGLAGRITPPPLPPQQPPFASIVRREDLLVPPERAVLEKALEEGAVAASMKATYFDHVGNGTSAHWTRHRFVDAGIRLRPIVPRIRLCACGDSVTREVYERFRDGFFNTQLSMGYSTFSGVCKTDFTHILSDPQNWEGCSLIVLGVPGLHTILRENGLQPEFNFTAHQGEYLFGPEHAHLATFRKLVRMASEVAQRLDTQAFLVGTPRVDGEVVISGPAKKDWVNFLPFDIANLFSLGERSTFASMRNSERARVHYLDLGAVTRRFPGIRCDGIHYGSQYKYAYPAQQRVVVCESSKAVYDPLILAALEKSGLLVPANPSPTRSFHGGAIMGP